MNVVAETQYVSMQLLGGAARRCETAAAAAEAGVDDGVRAQPVRL